MEGALKVTVQCYAGYKGEERPVSFVAAGQIFRVAEIVDRWYDPDAECFRVAVEDGGTALLRHDLNSGDWELLRKKTVE